MRRIVANVLCLNLKHIGSLRVPAILGEDVLTLPLPMMDIIIKGVIMWIARHTAMFDRVVIVGRFNCTTGVVEARLGWKTRVQANARQVAVTITVCRYCVVVVVICVVAHAVVYVVVVVFYVAVVVVVVVLVVYMLALLTAVYYQY